MNINIYLALVLWIFFCTIFSRAAKNKKKVFCVLCALGLFVVLAFRDPVGFNIDNTRYYRTYHNISNANFKTAILSRDGLDSLFYSIEWLFGHLGVSYELFQIIVAAFCIYATMSIVYKYSASPYLSVMLYLGLGLFSFSFYLLKQIIAVSIILLVYDSLINNKRTKAWILQACAVLIHDSAIVFVPVLFCRQFLKNNKVFLLFYSIIAGVFFVFRLRIAEVIMYLTKDDYVGVYQISGRIGGLALFIIACFLLFIVSIDYKKKNLSIDTDCTNELVYLSEKEGMLLFISATALIIQILSSYAYAYTRLNFFYIQFYMLILPNALYSSKIKHMSKNMYLLLKIIVYLVITVLMLMQFKNNIGELKTGYSFMWEMN